MSLPKQQYGAIYDLISEGPIDGLVNNISSVYYNATPLANSSQTALYGARAFTGSSSGTTLTSTGFFTSEMVGRFVSVPKAQAAGATNASVSANSNIITTTTGIFNSNFVVANAGFQYPRYIRIPGAGVNGEEYVGRIVRYISSTQVEIFPETSSAISSGAAVYIDFVGSIVNVPNANTATVSASIPRTVSNVTCQLFAQAIPAGQYEANFDDVSVDFRNGTRDQTPTSLSGAPSDSFMVGDGRDIVYNSGSNSYIVDPLSLSGLALTSERAKEISRVTLTLEFPAGLLVSQKDGDIYRGIAEFKVYLKYKKDAGQTEQSALVFGRTNTPNWPGNITGPDGRWKGSDAGVISPAPTRGSFLREIVIDLEKFKPFHSWRLELVRETPEDPKDYVGTNNYNSGYNFVGFTKLKTIEAQTNYIFSYPNSAYSLVTFSARDFATPPERSYHIRGKKVKVPTNYITREEIDSQNPNAQEAKYTRNTSTGVDSGSYVTWDGSFRGDRSLSPSSPNYEPVYTNNPAWVFYDIITNPVYGLGEFIQDSDIDKYALYQIARYCDELVDDGNGGLEPRFTCNVYFQSKQEAYKVLKDLASAFRGMMYWIDGQITAVQDRPKEPVYTFTQGNVIDGLFSYESTGQRARVNQVNVTWNNPEELYKQSVVTIDDIDNIVETGTVVTRDVVAFGSTSEGQARRVGRWHLLTDTLETEIVKFQTSINAGFLRPGDVINVQDSKLNSVEFSGRVSTGSTTTSIELDRNVILQAGETYNLYLIYPEPGCYLQQDSATINSTNYVRGDLILKDASNNDINTAEKAANLVDDSGNKVFTSFSASSRLEKKQISTSAGTVNTVAVSSAFSSAPGQEVVWAVSNVNEYQRTDAVVRYRVLAITEDSVNLFSIAASKYVYEKYDEIEKDYLKFVEPYKPSPSKDAAVPAPTNLKMEIVPTGASEEDTGGNTQKVVVSWNEPAEEFTDSSGVTTTAKYRFIDSYDIQHNFNGDDFDGGFITVPVSAARTSFSFDGVAAGNYTIKIRTRNFDGQTSPWTTITQLIKATQQPAPFFDRLTKVTLGGSINSPISFEDGVVGISNPNYLFVSTLGRRFEVISATSAESTVDFSGLSSGDTAYWLFDYSTRASDPWKVVEVHTDSVVQNTSGVTTDFSYWKEYGALNKGLTVLSGTVSSTIGSDILIGSGTSFTAHFSEGDLIKVSTNGGYTEVAGAEYLEVARVESDTVLYTKSNFTKSFSGAYAYKQSFKIDFLNDNILAEVTNTSGTFSIEYYVLKSGEAGVDGAGAITIDINPISVSVASASDGSVQASDLTGTAFEVYVYEGDTQLIVDSIPEPYAPGSFRWSLSDPATVTRATEGSSGTYDIIRLPDNTPIGVAFQPLSNIDTGVASVTIPIEITVVRLDGTEVTFNRSQSISKSAIGADGFKTAIVYAYQRSTTALTSNPGDVTVDFTTGKITTSPLANGWQAEPYDAPGSLYVVAASGASQSDSDTISASEWSAPAVLGQDGIDGLNTATAFAYQRTTTNTKPTLKPQGAEYTFSPFDLTFTTANGWSKNIPLESEGDYLWVVTATASSRTNTDTIDDGEWGDIVLLSTAGDPGLRTVQGYLYFESTGGEPFPPTGKTYTFSTGLVSGVGINDLLSTNVWKNTPNTQDPTSTNTHYTLRYYGTENSADSSTVEVTYSEVVQYTNFTGVVTFSGGTFSQGSNPVYDTTTIDGGTIKTGAIRGGLTPPLDANSPPGTGEAGAYLDLAAGKFVFGDSTKYINWDGTDLVIGGGVTIGSTSAETVESNANSAFQPGDTLSSGAVGPVIITSDKLYQGSGNFGLSDTGFYLDNLGRFSLRDKLSFDGTTLSVTGNITANVVKAGSGSNAITMNGGIPGPGQVVRRLYSGADSGPNLFSVDSSGAVHAQDIYLYDENENLVFSSKEGFQAIALTDIAQSTEGVKVTEFSENHDGADHETQITFSVSTTPVVRVIKNLANWAGFGFGATELSAKNAALADLPASFDLMIRYGTSPGIISTSGTLLTPSNVTGGWYRFYATQNTPGANQYRYEATTTFYDSELNTYFAEARIVLGEGAVNSSGQIILSQSGVAFSDQTYYIATFMRTADTTSFSSSARVGTSDPRTFAIQDLTAGGGFTVDGGASQTVGTGDITSVTINTSGGLTGGGTVLSGAATFNLSIEPTSFVDDLTIEKDSPKITLKDTNTLSGSYPQIEFETDNLQGVTLYHNEFDSELPVGGYGLVLGPSSGNTQFPSSGTLTLSVLGEMYAGGTTTSSLHKVWHAGNDGSGSGLDADLLDGQHASAFEPADVTILHRGADITSQDWNSFIDGTEASWNTVLNHSGSNRPSSSYGYGTALSFSKASEAKLQIYAPETSSSGGTTEGIWYRTGWNTGYRAWQRIWDSGNDGSGSGLDADLLDGQQGSYYLDYTNVTNKPTATDLLNQIKTVDGSGSGLDADTIDGLGSSDFLRSNANDSFSGKLTATGTSTNTALDLATNDQYASFRVIRNEGGYSNDGMYIGYANAGTGTTKIYGGGSTSNNLEVGNGFAHLDGSFTATGNVTAYSDERLKTDIKTLEGSKVFEMRGVSFIKDGELGSGVIAQELEKIAPELVREGEYKSVAYGNLVGYLIEAIKDLKSEVDTLKETLRKNNEE